MMIPVRCFTCGKVVGSPYEAYKARMDAFRARLRAARPAPVVGDSYTKEEERQLAREAQKVLDEVGLRRYCCRRMVVSQVDIIDDAAPYA